MVSEPKEKTSIEPKPVNLIPATGASASEQQALVALVDTSFDTSLGRG